jgi:hypothetical protein
MHELTDPLVFRQFEKIITHHDVGGLIYLDNNNHQTVE